MEKLNIHGPLQSINMTIQYKILILCYECFVPLYSANCWFVATIVLEIVLFFS